ncbi:MAG TPA: PEP-CTERM sorting domain-containing protein [Thermomicrobiales bacterium]|nr:PEP-CTERM sorting domain-containing protein [Thermomicrobiales bacterium]
MALAFACPAHAALLLVDASGQLTGATGVNVNGTLYDVSFVEGTCVDLFSGCDSASDFAFSSVFDANDAAVALEQLVLIGSFDTDPASTLGCEAGIVAACVVITPFAVATGEVLTTSVFNQPTTVDGLTGWPVPTTFDTSSSPFEVYAEWTPTPVPEPSTLMLIGTGLLGAGVKRWRRRRAE